MVASAAVSADEAAAFEAVRAAMGGDEVVRGPAVMLADYGTNRSASELFALLARARRIRESIDRLVFVAAGPSHHAMRLLFETCCHPFHNDLDRGERGGRPRLFFVGNDFDGDVLAGLFDIVAGVRAASRDDLLDRFGIVAIDDGDVDGTVRAALHLLRPALEGAGGPPMSLPAERLTELPAPGLSPFTTATLLPAAVVGIDVVRLLEGAVAMNVRFAEAPPPTNPVAFCLRPAPGARGVRLACVESRRLAAASPWLDAIRSGSTESAATVAISIGEPRRDPLLDPRGIPWQSRATHGHDVAAIRMPRLDEHAIGQLLQMLAIATVVGRRLDMDPSANKLRP
jgi:glucose-6-phosphate isomerase